MADTGQEFDPRITACRGDIAAAELEGRVTARRFVKGRTLQVKSTVAPLREIPDAGAATGKRETQLLYGEIFTVYDLDDDWAWGQSQSDDYVGYVQAKHLGKRVFTSTHRVSTICAHVYAEPDPKSIVINQLSFASPVAFTGDIRNGYAKLERGGWIFTGHVCELNHIEPDYAGTARKFLGIPYLFAGRSCFGIDCSALVQLSLLAAGVNAPRDSDMQMALGNAVEHPGDEPPVSLQRGDLVFFPGHIGIMKDAENLIHANMKQMKVSIDPVFEVAGYYRQKDGTGVTAVRRFD